MFRKCWISHFYSGILSVVGGLLFGRTSVVPGRGGAMHFRFDTRKVVEAAGVLLQCVSPHRMKYFRLVKLLYIADRDSLADTGWPIAGAEPVAMNNGPLDSKVLDLVKGTGPRSEEDRQTWSDFIRTDGMDVVLVRYPGTRSLSPYEIEKLKGAFRRYELLGRYDVRDLTHEFQEWKDNHVPGSSQPIPLEDIIRAVGRADDLDEITAMAEEVSALDALSGASPR